MSWKTGDFDRALVPEIFHRFVPAHAANTLHEIDLDRLWTGGKRLILLDVDHTIVKWKAEEFDDEILEWLGRAKTMSFDLCIISNTRHPERLGRLCTKLDIPTVRGKFKPSRVMFDMALAKFSRKPEEAVMIGDQLMTDILGANRAGIDAIWVQKMEGKEFAGTRVNRFMEGLLKSAIYKGILAPIDEQPGPGDAEIAVADRPITHQLVKFIIVGVSSAVIDIGVRFLLTFEFGQAFGTWLQTEGPIHSFFSERFVSPQNAAFPFFATISSILAIINSFIWNRLWTFQIRGKEERSRQFWRFVLVAGIGMLINVAISSALGNVLPGARSRALAIATLVATVVAAFWNFYGQRKIAFKPRSR